MRRTWLALLAMGLTLAPVTARAQEAEGEQQHEDAGDRDKDGKSGKGPKAHRGPAADPHVHKQAPDATPAGLPAAEHETNCSDRIDEDGDSVTDCADSDCLDSPACKKTGVHEKTDAL